jgi:uncharacterized repeat protein (TIGR01451 family)
MPKPFAILLAALLALFFMPLVGASPASAAGPSSDINLTLEGCRLEDDGTCTFTTGNLGKNWAELDLVPHRLTVDNKASTEETFEIIPAGDYFYNGVYGYDLFTAPEVVSGDCVVTVLEANQVSDNNIANGTDTAIGNVLKITIDGADTCVIEWDQRLAIGSHEFDGSNLQSRLYEPGPAGDETAWELIGQRTVPLPVNEIEPQTISKTAEAIRTQGFLWDITKTSESEPTLDSCLSDPLDTASVTYTVAYTRTADDPSGVSLVTGTITVTNPAHRALTGTITDVVSSNGTEIASEDYPVAVGAGASADVDYEITLPAGTSATGLANTATVVYDDPDQPGETLPGISATVAVPVDVTTVDDDSDTASILDEETIESPGQFKVTQPVAAATDWVTSDDFTVGPVSASGSFTVEKQVRATAPMNGTLDLTNSVTLTDGEGGTADAEFTVPVEVTAADPTLAITKSVDVLPDEPTDFVFDVMDGDTVVDTITVTFQGDEPAGAGGLFRVTSDPISVSPGTYDIVEHAPAGYAGHDVQDVDLDLCDEADVPIDNTRTKTSLDVKKVLSGDGLEGDADQVFTIHVSCTDGTSEDLMLKGGQTGSVTGILTGSECSVSEVNLPDGWESPSFSPSATVPVGYDPETVELVTVTNSRNLVSLDVKKVVTGPTAEGDPDQVFTVNVSCSDGTEIDLELAADETGTVDGIVDGASCTVSEVDIPEGWDQTPAYSPSATVEVGSSEGAVSLVTLTNSRTTTSLDVLKATTGVVPDDDADEEFTVNVSCTDGTDEDLALSINEKGTVSGILTGSSCTVTEVNIPSTWDQTPVYSPSQTVDVGYGEVKLVTVTNERLFGRISVTKNIVGAPNGASTSFKIDINCPVDAYDQTLKLDITSGTSTSAESSLIPTGMVCQVKEQSAADWNPAYVPSDGSVTVPGAVTVTNTRKAGVLNIAKAVSPVAGNGVVVEFGDTLTYTLTVSATGEATQHNVKVSDYIPGYDPARPTSGKTTYVAGSATCIGAGTCTVTGPDSAHLLTWSLGDMAAGTTRQVTFKVTIDDVAGDPGETVAVDILNAGAVQSTETPKKPSNQVMTPVTKVFPVKNVKPPKVLPHTGAGIQPGPLAVSAVSLLGLGVLLMAATRRRSTGSHRR